MTVTGLRSLFAGLPWPLGPSATLDLRPIGAAPSARRRATAALAVLALVGTGAAALAAPAPAHNNGTDGLAKVGPIDPANGFPIWYRDTAGQRLQLCVDPDDALCIIGAIPDPAQPVSFPGNFPDEAFYSVGDATIDLGGGNSAQLVTGLEAAFASADGLPAEKQQITFGRIRTRISGLTAGETYTVTHPFGKDVHVAEAGARGVNVTEDVGSLAWDGVFQQALASRPAPFLRWTTGAPVGYLGDPTVEHAVTGSPYNTNFFRVEGPAGSFPGSPQQCADITLGASTTTRDDCVETDQFLVQGKVATKLGVQLSKATYSVEAGGTFLNVWATTEPDQTIVVAGGGVPSTVLRGNAKGEYFGRIAVNAVPTTFALTNTTDEPDSVVPVSQADIGDAVHVSGALYDADARTLTVTAQSKDATAVLSLAGFTAPTVTGSGTFTVADVTAPPVNVTVTSSKGGADSDEVVVGGAGFDTALVDAILTAPTNHIVLPGSVDLDGSTSTVPAGATVEWTATQLNGTQSTDVSGLLSGTGLTRTFTPLAAGSYTVALKVTGSGAGNTDTAALSFTVDGAPAAPTANAGPDQPTVQPLSTVTLDGTGSSAGVTYAWTVKSATGVLASAIALSSPTAAKPTFVMPLGSPSKATPVVVTLGLTVTRSGQASTQDTVVVTSKPDVLTLTQAQFKSGEWRIRGDATYCGTANPVSVTYKAVATSVPVVLGTVTPALAAGVCSWDLRIRNTPLSQRPINGTGTVTILSRLGGQLLDQPFANR